MKDDEKISYTIKLPFEFAIDQIKMKNLMTDPKVDEILYNKPDDLSPILKRHIIQANPHVWPLILNDELINWFNDNKMAFDTHFYIKEWRILIPGSGNPFDHRDFSVRWETCFAFYRDTDALHFKLRFGGKK